MRTTLFVLFVCLLHHVNAATYYFSSVSGDDSRTSSEARNSSTPWKTLSKLNSFFSSLQPGDQVLLKRGETFYGSIIVKKSGTSGSPILIGAYGSGDKPVITSLVKMLDWVSKGNGIWESYNSGFSSTVNMVLLNNTVQELGRYPNSNSTNKGYLVYESHSGTYSITDNQLTSSTNWTGAEVVIRARRWILDRNLISSHSGTKISYQKTSSYAPYDKNGYFIQNSIKTLDKFGEWYYNNSSKKLSVYFGSNSPSSYTIQAATKDNLFYAEKYSNILIENLNFKGANASDVYIKYGSNINIQNTDIEFSGKDGVEAKFHDNFKIENSSISNSNNSGINLGYMGDYAVIRNNAISNTCVIPGLGASGDNNGVAILSCGNHSIIEYNKIKNTGYSGIWFTGSYVTIKNNLLDGFCKIKDDGAGIYTHIGSSDACVQRKVTGNIVINGTGAPEGTSATSYAAAEGIYADNNASDVVISGNTVANCANQGIYIHSSYKISILNNTIYNNDARQLAMIENTDNAKIRNCVITGNIIFSRLTTQTVAFINSPYDDIDNFGNFDNNYYARPYDKNSDDVLDKIKKFESSPNLNSFTKDVRFEYNATKESKTVSLDASYIDLKKNTYSGSLTLQPFTSVVLLKTGSSTGSSPVVSITSPTQNASYRSGASVNITATASDAGGSIEKVEFYDGSTLLHTETGSPYTWDWTEASIGTHTITAKATDNSGNKTTSAGVSITVTSSSSSYPAVSVTSPTQNASYSSGASINISANASDADGSIQKVEFYDGSTLLHTETGKPYTWDWNNASAGTHTITAKATDNSGNKTTSAGIIITVTSSSSSYPAVNITSPTQNAVYKSGATINISANADDDDGTIVKLEFYRGTTLLHTESGAPYSWDWKNVGTGNYTITAKATDNDGNVTTSAPVNISVVSSVSARSIVGNNNDTAAANRQIKADETNNKTFDFSLFPNPAISTIKINLDQPQNFQKAYLNIISMSGSSALSYPVMLSGKTIEINISSLRTGTYILCLTAQGFNVSKKFIKAE